MHVVEKILKQTFHDNVTYKFVPIFLRNFSSVLQKKLKIIWLTRNLVELGKN